MKPHFASLVIVLSGVTLLAQTPAPAPAAHTYSGDIGFSYSLPADWQVLEDHTKAASTGQSAAAKNGSDMERSPEACAQIVLAARHGKPASAIMVMESQYTCLGLSTADTDLRGFGKGIAKIARNSYILSNPVFATYSLGTHTMWIERGTAAFKDAPDAYFTMEITCGLLHKGAVCLMTVAKDEDSLMVFEHGSVTLEKDPSAALVPANAFQKTYVPTDESDTP